MQNSKEDQQLRGAGVDLAPLFYRNELLSSLQKNYGGGFSTKQDSPVTRRTLIMQTKSLYTGPFIPVKYYNQQSP